MGRGILFDWRFIIAFEVILCYMQFLKNSSLHFLVCKLRFILRSQYVDPDTFKLLSSKLQPSNLLAVTIAAHTGLRIDDVLCLRIENLKTRITVVEKKTGNKRRVYIGKKLMSLILKFVGTRKSGFVFPHRLDPERHRTRQAVFKDVKKQASELGLSSQISPHSFRKVYAVKLFKRIGSLEAVQRILGHKKMETTLIYALADVIK